MRTTVVCTCNGELRRRDGHVKLVENVVGSCDGVPELSGGFRWVRCRAFVNSSIPAKLYAKTVAASTFGWNCDGFTEQCLWPRGFVSRERAGEARRCDRGPHVQEQLCSHITFFVCSQSLQ